MTSALEVVTALKNTMVSEANSMLPLVLPLIGISLAIFLSIKFYAWAKKALK